MKFIQYLILLFFGFSLGAQTTVGLLSYDITQSYQGYTMIYPHNQPNVYLLDNCGEIVHVWEDDAQFRPGNTAYLLDNGNLVKTKRNAAVGQDSIWAGGGGAIIEIRTWDNDLLWSYELNDPSARLHHDVEVMPNGNILAIAGESVTEAEAIENGRDPATINQGAVWPDYIFEIDPNTDEIVWEWHVWDHLIQDFDSTKANYGVISDNPGLVDINLDTNDGKADWLHSNAIDYNEDLDHIMLSVPQFDELWIIDHSTTTEQAATNRGGRSNRGGNLIYRAGNDMAYGRGDSTSQILFYQHDTHWVNEFVPDSHPFKDHIVCFNNRVGADFSTVEVFDPEWEMYSGQYATLNGVYAPGLFTNTITHPDPQAVYSTGLSSAQLLPNGNFLICSGRFGYIVELTPGNEVVWEYKTPRKGTEAATQGDTLTINNNLTFRAFRYPPEYVAFEGRELEPLGFIENEPIEDWCDRLVTVSTPEFMEMQIFPNPATDLIHLSWDSGELIDIEVIDVLGRVMIRERGNGGMKYLDISQLENMIYFIRVDQHTVARFYKN